MNSPRIVRLSVDSRACLAHELCVKACPQVFSLAEGVVSLNPNFQQYLETHAEQILKAEGLCPTRAIVVETEPPRPQPPASPLDPTLKGKSIAELLRAARGLPPMPPWWKFWRR
ncbi:MAG: ferredoxin [Planctomycetaceae bacterium]|nr:ferredoxin [Planctomycetaceae bacterium]